MTHLELDARDHGITCDQILDNEDENTRKDDRKQIKLDGEDTDYMPPEESKRQRKRGPTYSHPRKDARKHAKLDLEDTEKRPQEKSKRQRKHGPYRRVYVICKLRQNNDQRMIDPTFDQVQKTYAMQDFCLRQASHCDTQATKLRTQATEFRIRAEQFEKDAALRTANLINRTKNENELRTMETQLHKDKHRLKLDARKVAEMETHVDAKRKELVAWKLLGSVHTYLDLNIWKNFVTYIILRHKTILWKAISIWLDGTHF